MTTSTETKVVETGNPQNPITNNAFLQALEAMHQRIFKAHMRRIEAEYAVIETQQPLEGTSNAILVSNFMTALQKEQQRVLDQGESMVRVVELALATPEAPKPRPFKAVTPQPPTLPKPVFVLKPHLTTRPLKDNEALAALKQSLLESTPTRPRRK